jgi:hypothetical protein
VSIPGIHETRGKKKTKRSSPSHLFANSIKTQHSYSWLAVAQKHGRERGKKETMFHGKSKLLSESNWVQFQWTSVVKEVGITSNGKWEVPELGRLWDMRYLWPGSEILKWRNIGF